MEELLWWMIVVVGLQVALVAQGWLTLWLLRKADRRINAIESEHKQFRGVAKLRDIPNEKRNGIHNDTSEGHRTEYSPDITARDNGGVHGSPVSFP